MAIPELERYRAAKLLEQYCAQKRPPHLRDKVRLNYSIRGSKALLIETRPHFMDPDKWTEMTIAQFEYDSDSNSWTLYCYDRNSKRRPYFPQSDKGNLEKLIAEVNKDPTGIFWG